jgi:hypothetical protein
MPVAIGIRVNSLSPGPRRLNSARRRAVDCPGLAREDRPLVSIRSKARGHLVHRSRAFHRSRVKLLTAIGRRPSLGDVTAVSGANIDGGAERRRLETSGRAIAPTRAIHLHRLPAALTYLWRDLGQTPQHIIKDSELRALRLIFASQHITAKFNRIAPILRNPNDPLNSSMSAAFASAKAISQLLWM